MSDPITYGGVAVTVFLVVLSLRAEKWWPVFYAPAVLLWFSTGVLAWSWPEGARDAWWLVWLLYAFALPVFRVELARRARRVEREERQLRILREGCSVTFDDPYIYVRDASGKIIDKVVRIEDAQWTKP